MEMEEDDPGIPEWVVTFGDMMSLLLTFFIMLVSMSEIKEEERYQAMVESMRAMFGHSQAQTAFTPGDETPRNSNMRHIASQGRAKRRDTLRGGDISKAPIGENARVTMIRPGQNTTLGGVVQFKVFEATLTPEAELTLQSIAEKIVGKPQRVEVRGHTVRRPVPQGRSASNHYDLAFQRCMRVAEFLEQHGVNRQRIHIGVAGATQPHYKGVDPDQQATNARVEIFMWDERVLRSQN